MARLAGHRLSCPDPHHNVTHAHALSQEIFYASLVARTEDVPHAPLVSLEQVVPWLEYYAARLLGQAPADLRRLFPLHDVVQASPTAALDRSPNSPGGSPGGKGMDLRAGRGDELRRRAMLLRARSLPAQGRGLDARASPAAVARGPAPVLGTLRRVMTFARQSFRRAAEEAPEVPGVGVKPDPGAAETAEAGPAPVPGGPKKSLNRMVTFTAEAFDTGEDSTESLPNLKTEIVEGSVLGPSPSEPVKGRGTSTSASVSSSGSAEDVVHSRGVPLSYVAELRDVDTVRGGEYGALGPEGHRDGGPRAPDAGDEAAERGGPRPRRRGPKGSDNGRGSLSQAEGSPEEGLEHAAGPAPGVTRRGTGREGMGPHATFVFGEPETPSGGAPALAKFASTVSFLDGDAEGVWHEFVGEARGGGRPPTAKWTGRSRGRGSGSRGRPQPRDVARQKYRASPIHKRWHGADRDGRGPPLPHPPDPVPEVPMEADGTEDIARALC